MPGPVVYSVIVPLPGLLARNDRSRCRDSRHCVFKKRHPKIALRSPEHLQMCRIRCYTTEAISEWFFEFDQFLQKYDVKDKPTRIWNADESGFSLCSKTGKVITIKNARNVYGVTGDSKEQITTLCAANAAGNVLPPMHIYSGQRFSKNPMEGCVADAYFGRSPNGWMSTELFLGWITNHFAKRVVECPVVLLVDGHSTHVNIDVSKFCQDKILLYCLPPPPPPPPHTHFTYSSTFRCGLLWFSEESMGEIL